jgi:hypothetical protein
MKKIIYFVLLLLNFSLYAQRSGGAGGRGGGRQNQSKQGQQNNEVKEFKASDVAGVFYYDIDKVLKKLKIKDEAAKTSTSKFLKEYNFKIREISFLNSTKFKEYDVIINALPKQTRESRNQYSEDSENGSEKKKDIRKKVRDLIRPVKEKVLSYENELNKALQEVLSKKQEKKWMKYQKKQKEKIMPQKRERNNNQSQNQRGSRQRGGF